MAGHITGYSVVIINVFSGLKRIKVFHHADR
jgi:hypothetical protein